MNIKGSRFSYYTQQVHRQKKNKLTKSCFRLSGLQIIFETLRVQMNTSYELELTPGFDPEFPRKNPDEPSLGTISTAMLGIWYGPFHRISTKKLSDDWLNIQDRIQPRTYITKRGFISVRRKFFHCQETKSRDIGITWTTKKCAYVKALCFAFDFF